jgi:hypothetical protein
VNLIAENDGLDVDEKSHPCPPTLMELLVTQQGLADLNPMSCRNSAHGKGKVPI